MDWRAIAGFADRYEVSSTGLVRARKSGKVLAGQTHRHGYITVNLWVGNMGKHVYVHRLVAACFVEGHFDGAEVNHLDGDKSNNVTSNLEWADRSKNVRHSYTDLIRKPHSKTIPVSLGGVLYPSLLSAAKSHDVTVGAVWAALKNNRLFKGKDLHRV